MAASLYTLTGKSFSKKTGQAKQVFDAMAQLARPVLIADIVPVLKANPAFRTNQTTLRIAAYYVCVGNKEGIVRRADRPEDVEANASFDAGIGDELMITSESN